MVDDEDRENDGVSSRCGSYLRRVRCECSQPSPDNSRAGRPVAVDCSQTADDRRPVDDVDFVDETESIAQPES